MKERIISICVLLLAAVTVWLLAAEVPKKHYAKPAADFTEAVRNGTPPVADEVIRLHILADSDSEYDQSVKLALRDVLLPYINAATIGAESKTEALAQLNAQCPVLTEIANAFLTEQGTGYTASVAVKNVYFPIRIYGSQTYLSEDAVIFPPGYYDSVQVILGSGEGHNWWCLAYPSLCFVDSMYDYIPKDSDIYKLKIGTMSDSSLEELFYGESTSGETTIYFGSKLLELLKALFDKNFAKNSN